MRCRKKVMVSRLTSTMGKLSQLEKSVFPKLVFSKHKGQAGRVAVVGGSPMYTGAPYFAGMAALRLGADLVTVICDKEAGIPIKCLSPELMVSPILESEEVKTDNVTLLNRIDDLLARQHAVVIGPGLGRNENVLRTILGVIDKAKERALPIVLDADALHLITMQSGTPVQGYKTAILTPNVVEFQRLWKQMFPGVGDCEGPYSAHDDSKTGKPSGMLFKYEGVPNCHEAITETAKLASALGGVTIVRKGPTDIITNGRSVILCDEQGMPRRCGGQGDLTAGFAGVFAVWAKNLVVLPRVWHERGFEPRVEWQLLAGYMACRLTRMCARAAYDKHRRATLTSDILTEIGPVVEKNFPARL